MSGLKELARRAAKGAAAIAMHYSGARELLTALQRRAVGGRRVLILSYHRVVKDFAAEKHRTLYTLNIGQQTFRRHLEVLQRAHDIVPLDDALEVLSGKRTAKRDVAVVTFDDGYRDVYHYAFPVMREMKVPGIVYMPSAFAGTTRKLGHDRLWLALEQMRRRRITPMAAGVGGEGERWLIDALEGNASPALAVERLIDRHPTPALLAMCTALEKRLGIDDRDFADGQLPCTWEMLREMDAHGVITGAHTADHTVLTHATMDEVRREIAECRQVLERNVRKPVRHFAYCNGLYSAGVAQALRAEGFVSAVTTEDIPNVPDGDPYALKRKVLWESSSAGMFGECSDALLACQFGDAFGMLTVQKPVMGARPTNFTTRPERRAYEAHGS